ncbi:hypothetical protein BC332_10664 [Capsicum chinense]|nr:hypothetical protein BC332_10664 [Capsicum chinense]
MFQLLSTSLFKYWVQVVVKGSISAVTKVKNVARAYSDATTPLLQTTSGKTEFAREARLDKKKFVETRAEAFFPVRAINGVAPSHNAVNYSCVVQVNGQDFLELPGSWEEHLPKRENKKGTMIIFIRGPDNRIWPTFYQRRTSHFDVLKCGWEQVTAAYGLNTRDACLFPLVNQPERIFDVRKR